ncbi:isoprenyl transferase 1 isoform X2 [Folsomia candida]|uniref:isoprenyl transferase 1 isoform X2 n=1 Tax=Folsomia candida TaxID=158441 RepID=UPI0016055CE4|nr:isoprenyl transferase 1 isoform X2 [Folsomia candida]
MHRDSQSLSWFEILMTSMARMGPVPDHVAIIMDGNRRYARRKGLKVRHGHEAGADNLMNLDRWGKAVGCKELTVYAFSSENFKRSKEEVDHLMDLMGSQCACWLQEIESGDIKDVCIQMMGKWDNFPAELRHRMANVMQKTRHFKPYKFNIAVGYTGREGILRSLDALSMNNDEQGEDLHRLMPSQWNEYLVEQSQHLLDMRPVDLLVRTGGDCRLSDFMMWEASQACIHFTTVTWPEFNFKEFIHAMLVYQVHRRKVSKQSLAIGHLSKIELASVQPVLEKSRNDRWARIERLAKKDTSIEKITKIITPPNKLAQILQNLTKF